MNASLVIAAKDLRVELRSKEMISAMFLFSLLIVLSFRFAFSDAVSSGGASLDDIAASGLWICFSFAAIVGMHSSFAKEKDRETLEGLLLAPVDRSSVFLGKALSNLVIVFSVDLISILFFALFFSFDFGGQVGAVIGIAFLGTVTLVLVGTLVAAISVNARAREVLLPVLLIPLIAFSVIIPSVSATRNALSGDLGEATGEIQSILAFALIFAAIGYLTIDYVLEG
jgi:heme exporter protein B